MFEKLKISVAVKAIRRDWKISDAKRDEGLTTPEDIQRYDGISYGPHGEENTLDIYVQKTVTEKQPTIVNVHGGGWVYGSTVQYQYYCMSLAQRGFTVVNINYRLAPETKFPGAVEDINQVMTFIAEQGEKYHIDKDRLVMVGDSAGGQLVSHYATIWSNPAFAKLFDFKVPDVKIKAVGLNCGTYDGRSMCDSGTDGFFVEYLGYVGKKVPEEVKEKVDAMKYMTSDFPPAFVMSAVNDFLVTGVEPMYQFLTNLGVPCKMHIYGSKERTEVAHVFHVNIRLEEATQCNDDECEFFRQFV